MISTYLYHHYINTIFSVDRFAVDDKPTYRLKIEENLVKAQQKADDEVKKRNEKKKENDKYVLRKAMDVCKPISCKK